MCSVLYIYMYMYSVYCALLFLLAFQCKKQAIRCSCAGEIRLERDTLFCELYFQFHLHYMDFFKECFWFKPTIILPLYVNYCSEIVVFFDHSCGCDRICIYFMYIFIFSKSQPNDDYKSISKHSCIALSQPVC
jgi:hypothetical protein